MKLNSDKVLILGTGALATLFASRLAASGVGVTMLGTWQAGLAVLQRKGVQVEGEDQTFQLTVTDDPNLCKGIHFALVLVKSWQTERVARQLTLCLADDGVALTLQNGLGNDSILSSELGPARVMLGVTTLGATLLAPGLVRQGGEGDINLQAHPRLSPLAEMLRRAGFKVTTVEDVRSLIWGKLVVNSAINPLTALLQVKNGELLKYPSVRKLVGYLATETASVAGSLHIPLPFSDPEIAAVEVAKKTGSNISSMLQDVLRGAPTEVEAINGAVVRLAEQKALLVPVNRSVLSLVKALPLRGKII